MLTNAEIRRIADQVLSRVLGAHGFERSEVRSGEDHDGAPSIFVDVFFREGSTATPGEARIDAISGVANALEERGDTRFPYLRSHFAGDEIGVE